MSMFNLPPRKKHRELPITLLLYTTSYRNLDRALKIYNSIDRRIGLLEAYIAYYGHEKTRARSRIPIYISQTPYSRGEAIASVARFAMGNIFIALNLDSKCVSIDRIMKYIDMVLNGESVAVFSIPYVVEDMLKIYEDFLNDISIHIPAIKSVPHFSYSFIATIRKYVEESQYSFWSIEPFIALNIPSDKLNRIYIDTYCTDSADIVSGFEEIALRDFIEKFLKHVVYLKIVEKNSISNYLNKYGVSV